MNTPTHTRSEHSTRHDDPVGDRRRRAELEPELADLDHDVDFWVELQLDSMDHLAVMTRLSEQTGVDIAERDYPRLTTVNSLRDFLAAGGT